MPGKVKVKIISGKNLPVMDRSSDTTDAYVEIKLGNTTYKTDVCRRTLHPQWNTDWYRFEVDDSELQDEPLQIRLMDHDTYSANDAIGKVYLNLNPLLLPVAGQLAIGDNNPHHEISGWIPVYDTMHGIRGEVNVTVKVELFSDFNRYRQSSCGVHFFYSPSVPHGYHAKIINGFVEELIVDDDPEYQWIDKIRTPRASNEARQTLFFKLSGELQRKIGVKALNLGGNAVIGYQQSFDLEGESGIVARGIGTAVTLVKAHNVHHVFVETKEETIESYLNFVGDGKSFSLHPASPSHRFHFPFPSSSPFPLFDLNSFVPAPKLKNRQYGSLDSDTNPLGSHPNSTKSGVTSIKTLLNQEEKRGESAMARRFQKFKYSQKSLSKKMIALKAKLNSSIGEEADEDLPTPVQDKRKYFKKSSSDSSAMAEILARSVIHATTSLSSILEQPPEPKEDDTMQKLEPIANLLNKTESQTSINDDNVSDAQSYSSSESSSSGSDYEYRYYGKSGNDVETISNVIKNVEKLQRCLSKEVLRKQYSMPSIPTRGFSLSSLDSFGKVEGISDYNDNQENYGSISKQIEAAGTSANKTDSLSNRDFESDVRTLPKKQDLETIEGEVKEIPQMHSNEEVLKQRARTAMEILPFDQAERMGNPKSHDQSSEIHLQQKDHSISHKKLGSIKRMKSEPGSMVNTQTMLMERAELIGNMKNQNQSRECELQQREPATSHFRRGSLKSIKSEPGSMLNTALQTMLMERAELMGNIKDQNQNQESELQQREPASSHSKRGSMKSMKSEPGSMLNTALQTMLMERAELMGNIKDQNQNQDSELQQRETASSPSKRGSMKSMKSVPGSMLNTALQTMLMERAELMGNIKNQNQNTESELPQREPISSHSKRGSMKSMKSEPGSMLDTALQTMLMERAELMGNIKDQNQHKESELPQREPTSSHSKRGSMKSMKSEPGSMLDTALQTMLMERAELMGNIKDQNQHKESELQQREPASSPSKRGSKKSMKSEPGSMLNTALQTMLMERAELMGNMKNQNQNTESELPQGEPTSSHSKRGSIKSIKSEPGSMVNTDPQTTVYGRANSSHNAIPAVKQEHECDAMIKSRKDVHSEAKGMVETALKTMLFEKTNILGTPENVNVEDEHYLQHTQRFQSGILENENRINDLMNGEKTNKVSIMSSHSETSHNSSIFENFSSYPPNEINAIAPVTNEINIEPKKMFKTAMQTMLLEKVNILGTYTPPTSPSSEEKSSDANSSFVFNERRTEERKTTIPKSFSSASLGEHQRHIQKETVLGMPFTSLSSLTLENEDTFFRDRSCLSDSHLHQPILETLQQKDSAVKKRFNFIHMKNGAMFNIHKFLKHNKKSLPDDDAKMREPKEVVKEHHQNILSRMFHLRHEEKSIKDEETQTSNEVLDQPQQPQLSDINTSSNNLSKTEILSPEPPGKTDLASGDSAAHSKTKLACITSNRHHSSPAPDKQEHNGGDKKYEHSPEPGAKMSHSPVKANYMVPLHRRSSDSDLSITPKGNSLTGSDRSMGNAAAYFMRNSYIRRGFLNQENFEMLEYPFLTMTKFSPRFIVQIGGSISARSVKLLERISNPEEPESRDIWWSEIRMEIRSHARSLNCNAVLGYTESSSICDDVCVLSACGTAAVVDLNFSMGDEDVALIQRSVEKDKNLNGHKTCHDSPDHREHSVPSCGITHLPYDEKTVHLKAKVSKCPMCLKGKVPEVLIATIEPAEALPIIGKGCFIESHVSRPLKDLRGETIAKEISDGLPFLEYELHRLLVNKLKIRAMNAIFSLKVRITVGEKMLIGVATGTALYLSSLPSPDLPMLVTDRVSDEKIVADLQEMLKETVKKNREIYQIKDDNQNHKPISDDDSDEEQASLDISCGNKDCCILEMDDPEDAEVLNLLMEEKIPDGFHVVSTESVPGLEDLEIVKNLQMFTQIYRVKLAPPYNLQKHFVRLLQSVYFKLRRMVPCALCDLQFRVDLPEPDEIQLCVIGMALGLGKKIKKVKPVAVSKRPEEDLMFRLDEDPQESPPSVISKSNPSSLKYRGHRSPSKYRSQSAKQRHVPYNERHGVDITPLSYVPGGNIEQYLGNLNFFFIRETTSIREEGGLSGFIHSFVNEVLAIVRSHVTALGGNALVAFFMTECVLNHNLHKNQGQCLINVGGDVVYVSYFKDDP